MRFSWTEYKPSGLVNTVSILARYRLVQSAHTLRRLLETADQCFIGHLVYYYSISNYANPIALKQATMTWYVIIITALCAA